MIRSQTAQFLKQYATANQLKIVDLLDQLANTLGPISMAPEMAPYSTPRVASVSMSGGETLPKEDPFTIETKDVKGAVTDEDAHPKNGRTQALREASREKLAQIAKGLKTPEPKRCPHGIAEGGYCKACGGFAK